MSREFPSDKLVELIATPGDSFVVMADTEFYKKDDLEPMIEEVKKAHEQFLKKISRLTKEHNINLDIKTIVIADEHS
jgi:hypothetical protein